MRKQTKNEEFASRLINILQKLNAGETLKIDELMAEHNTVKRTIQRDLNERLAFLPLEKLDSNSYRLDSFYLGKLTITDIRRFADFARVSDMFSKIDQSFFSKYLLDSINIKSLEHESIADKQAEFDLINQAILTHKKLSFFYRRVKQQDQSSKAFEIEPYKLVNKNGIWYLIGLHQEKIKVFSFTRISLPQQLSQAFEPQKEIIKLIESGDGIYFEGVLDEVILKVDSKVAVYFTRRAILPNQEIVQELTDGTLIVMCKKVHEQEILPLVRYWIPHVEIVAPDAMKVKLMQELQQYMDSPSSDFMKA